jgi:ABC-type transport system substrate-binding protein
MRQALRSWGGLLTFILLLAGVSLLGRAAEPPGKGKPSDKVRPPEQEEDVRPKNKKLKNLDPDHVDKPARPIEQPIGDLGEAASVETNEVVKNLYKLLAVAHDEVRFQNTDRAQHVKPVSVFLKDGMPVPSGLRITPLDPNEKLGNFVKTFTPYEQLALDAVKQFLDQKLHTLPNSDLRQLSRLKQLGAAERVLTAVGGYHDSAWKTKEREGDGWPALETSLAKELFSVRVQQLQELLQARDWDAAMTLGRRLWDTYPAEDDQALIARPLVTLLGRAVGEPEASREKMREVRQKLGELVRRYPKTFERLGDELKEQARDLFKQGKEAEDKKDYSKAQDLLHQAEETWPQLPELRDFRQRVTGNYPILRVGVRKLPKFLSPGWATTDSELRAVEMLFESLVKVSPDAEGVLRYQPGLSHGRPQLLALGRQFQLPRNALWSNNQPVTTGDVRYTVRQLKKGVGTGRARAWGEMLDEVEVRTDPFQVNVLMKQGYLEPLSLMTFKILPDLAPSVLAKKKAGDEEETKLSATEKDFALKPVGSGPFQFDDIRKAGGREYASFVANLNYRSRPGKLGQPRIREVQFYEYKDPLHDLNNLRLHLLLDLSAEEVTALQQQADSKVTVRPPLPGNRRVYFLAVNHRQTVLQNAELRLALAKGINREAILTTFFRGKLGQKFHKALNSPFPVNSWALDPKLHSNEDKDSLDPHDSLGAKVLAKNAKDKLQRTDIKLTLKFPSGDKQTASAMEGIRQLVDSSTGIKLELVECDPYQLRKDVEETHNYDLAYYHYDFPDDTYWLLPLLGPHGLAEGGNYLGYDNSQLTVQMQQISKLRDFVTVREKMQHVIHLALTKEMPVIPLWQLDPLLAVHKDLKPVPFDPWLVFSDIDQWKLDGQ